MIFRDPTTASPTKRRRKRHEAGKKFLFLITHISDRRSKRRASQGMTSAILMIAFIITSAGIAAIVLTLGAEIQIELGNVGDKGSDLASSAIRVEGGIITAYGNATAEEFHAFAFNIRLVLDSGKVDLGSDAITIFLKVDYEEETELISGGSATTLQNAAAAGNSGKYGISWPWGSGDVLSSGEMARFYFGVANASISPRCKVYITIISMVATLKIIITPPMAALDGTQLV